MTIGSLKRIVVDQHEPLLSRLMKSHTRGPVEMKSHPGKWLVDKMPAQDYFMAIHYRGAADYIGRIPRAPSFHVGAQRSALSSGSGGNAIAEPSGWSGSSASRNFHHTSARLFAKASCPSFVFSMDSHDATKDTGSIPLSFSRIVTPPP